MQCIRSPLHALRLTCSPIPCLPRPCSCATTAVEAAQGRASSWGAWQPGQAAKAGGTAQLQQRRGDRHRGCRRQRRGRRGAWRQLLAHCAADSAGSCRRRGGGCAAVADSTDAAGTRAWLTQVGPACPFSRAPCRGAPATSCCGRQPSQPASQPSSSGGHGSVTQAPRQCFACCRRRSGTACSAAHAGAPAATGSCLGSHSHSAEHCSWAAAVPACPTKVPGSQPPGGGGGSRGDSHGGR